MVIDLGWRAPRVMSPATWLVVSRERGGVGGGKGLLMAAFFSTTAHRRAAAAARQLDEGGALWRRWHVAPSRLAER